MDKRMPGLLMERVARLKATDDGELQTEILRFVYFLFESPAIRPATLHLRRVGRPCTEQFLKHQASMLDEARTLTRELLLQHPHSNGWRDTCTDPECRRRIAELNSLLRKEAISDIELVGTTVTKWTTARSALEHLQYCACVHGAKRIGAMATWLWGRHKKACLERAERLRFAPGRSLDVLLSWLSTDSLSRGSLPAAEVRHHVNRIAAELLSISATLSATRRAVERLCAACELEADHLRTTMLGWDSERLTSIAVEHLMDSRIPAWSLAGRRLPRQGMTRPLAVQTVAYGTNEPLCRIVDSIRHVHALLDCPEMLVSEALLLLARVGGPTYQVPPRLEFERFGLSLASVDLADATMATTERVFVEREEVLEAIGQPERPTVVTNESEPTATQRQSSGVHLRQPSNDAGLSAGGRSTQP